MVKKGIKIGLALGSATCLFRDLDDALDLTEFDVVVAANEAGVAYSGRLDAWVTLHPIEMSARVDRRESRRYTPCVDIVSHLTNETHPGITRQVEYKFKGQRRSGSSGLFAVKYALVELGCSHVICAGIPISAELGRIDGRDLWGNAPVFRGGWLDALPHIKNQVRSMSGWTSRLLGTPTSEWLSTSCR